jgi:ribonuclease BN (tRNA processing enzyme)
MGYAIEDREWSFPIRFSVLRPGRAGEIGPVRVEAFPVHHQPHTMPHGFAVELGARRLVYSGDTGFFAGLPERVGDADLFVCECTYLDSDVEYHISHQALVARKHEFRCQRILLTHLGEAMRAHGAQAAFETADDGLRARL